MRRRTVWLLAGVPLLAVVGAGVCLCTATDDVPLRVGMTKAEVDEALVDSNDPLLIDIPPYSVFDDVRAYYTKPGWFGNRQLVFVRFDDHGVVDWEVKPLPGKRPGWLDWVKKAAPG